MQLVPAEDRAVCLVPSSVSIFAAGSLEPSPSLLSLYLQRPSTLGPTWCSHSHLCPDTEIHHSVTLFSSKCLNVVSIKYLLVRPQTATWARARWHNTQCSHPLSIPSSTVLYFIVLHCTVLYCTVLYFTVLYCVCQVAQCAVFPSSVSVLPLL